jgi:hypothetical protein
MMARKKTYPVETLVNKVNTVLKNSAPELVERRKGAMILLEEVLHNTGNYGGFRYLLANEVEHGPPGVNYLGNMPHPDYDRRFANTDHTRVHYFIK